MALLALAPACGFSSSGGGTDVGPPCFGSVVRICFDAGAVPMAPRSLPATEIDTDKTASGDLCDQNNDQKASYCVVTGAPLTLAAGAVLTAHGDKPLVLLSTTTMELLGDIDVSSHLGGPRGPGANPSAAGACSFMTAPMVAQMGGGGYGASLGTLGGSGGNAGTQTMGGGVAGTKLDTFPMALRGGCKGGDGSLLTIDSPGVGGDGGGAIALIAAMQIRVDAMINASGGGGHGGALNAQNGGGGGGAGGMIVLDSPVALSLGARIQLWANGGGGGQGGGAVTGADGSESTGPTQAASGGSGSGTGGAGGNGSLGSGTGAGGASTTLGGGGGGGGGAGFIHAPGFTDVNSISPPSSDPPLAP
jgi:hypothetical protein